MIKQYLRILVIGTSFFLIFLLTVNTSTSTNIHVKPQPLRRKFNPTRWSSHHHGWLISTFVLGNLRLANSGTVSCATLFSLIRPGQITRVEHFPEGPSSNSTGCGGSCCSWTRYIIHKSTCNQFRFPAPLTGTDQRLAVNSARLLERLIRLSDERETTLTAIFIIIFENCEFWNAFFSEFLVSHQIGRVTILLISTNIKKILKKSRSIKPPSWDVPSPLPKGGKDNLLVPKCPVSE